MQKIALGFFMLATAATHASAACPASLFGRTGHSLAYDARTHRVLMFGGSSDEPDDPYPRSLWAWTGERWECLSADGPPGRRDAFLAYDAARSRLVLFGGRTLTPDRRMHFMLDTWEWDGARWTEVDTAGPGPRIHGAVAYDPSRRGVVVHRGGGAQDILSDTWLWNGARWQTIPVRAPRDAIGNSMFSTDGGLVILSAVPDSAPECARLRRAQLGVLRGDSLLGLGGRGPCYSPQAPAARTAAGFLLFASWEPGGAAITWIFDKDTWRRAATSPPRRRGSQAAFDEARNRVVIFGGDDDHGLLSDTWEWDGETWTRRG